MLTIQNRISEINSLIINNGMVTDKLIQNGAIIIINKTFIIQIRIPGTNKTTISGTTIDKIFITPMLTIIINKTTVIIIRTNTITTMILQQSDRISTNHVIVIITTTEVIVYLTTQRIVTYSTAVVGHGGHNICVCVCL